MLYQVGKERKSKQERSANDNSAWYFLTKSDCCVGQCYRPYGHYLTKFHDHVMWEWLLPPFGRCRSWRLRRWSTELVSHRANLQTQVCPTQMEKQNCILALPRETNLDWLLVSPWTHTWSIQFLLITKSKTLGNKVPSLWETILQAELSLCIIYVQLGRAWLDAPVRAEPGNQKNTVPVGIQIPLLSHPTPSFPSWKQRERTYAVSSERSLEDRASVTWAPRAEVVTITSEED